MAERRQIHWGILGDAGINAAFIPGVQSSVNGDLLGIASRRPGNAKQVARRWGIPRAYNSYDELLADPDVDAVYIPLPNHLHAEWTVRAAVARKHVLCEKPLALSEDEVAQMESASRANNVLVMEAFMYRFLPRWKRAEEMVRTGVVGDPRIIRIGFAFVVRPEGYNIRFDPKAGGGIIWDMGCYAVNMARMLLQAEPVSIFTVPHHRDGCPVETSVEMIMQFPDERAAVAHCSFDYPNPYSQVEVVGSEGWISLPGTGIRREPVTYLLNHRYRDPDDEIFLRKMQPDVEEFPFADPFRLEAEHLADAILTETDLDYGFDDARANTRALLAAHRSAQEGRVVPVAG